MTGQPTGWEGRGDTPQDAPDWIASSKIDTGPSQPPTAPPRPTGPNWGLTLLGLVLMGVAAVVLVQQVTGVTTVTSLAQHGPLLLVGAGVACALVGVVGMARRRP